MLGVTLLCVGKLKESFYQEACREYEKRLGAFCRFSCLQTPEQGLPEKPSQAQIDRALQLEGEKLIERIPRQSFTVALCVEGKACDSETLSARLAAAQTRGLSHLTLVIGGSYGLSPQVKAQAQLRLSLSPMTFPHHLARVMVLEQLYRCFQIAGGSRYHK